MYKIEDVFFSLVHFFRFLILHWFISANLFVQICPATYFFPNTFIEPCASSPTLFGLVKSSSLNVFFFQAVFLPKKSYLDRLPGQSSNCLLCTLTNAGRETSNMSLGFLLSFIYSRFFPISCFTWGQEPHWQWNGLLWSGLPCCAAASPPGCHCMAVARVLIGKLHLLFVEGSSSTSNVCSV